MLISLIMNASFVGNITIFFLQLRDGDREQPMQEAQIRRYMKENRISTDLNARVVRFFRVINVKKLRRHTMDSEPPVINELPTRTRVELHEEIYMPILSRHHGICMIDRVSLVSVCHLAMRVQHQLAGQTVFSKGEEARGMIFSVKGKLNYYLALDDNPNSEMLGAGTWLCEAVLWMTKWMHA